MSHNSARTILILEDEPLIALDLQTMLEAEGFRNIEVIGNCADAEIRKGRRRRGVQLCDVGTKTLHSGRTYRRRVFGMGLTTGLRFEHGHAELKNRSVVLNSSCTENRLPSSLRAASCVSSAPLSMASDGRTTWYPRSIAPSTAASTQTSVSPPVTTSVPSRSSHNH